MPLVVAYANNVSEEGWNFEVVIISSGSSGLSGLS
jgi:hypothetical protein